MSNIYFEKLTDNEQETVKGSLSGPRMLCIAEGATIKCALPEPNPDYYCPDNGDLPGADCIAVGPESCYS